MIDDRYLRGLYSFIHRNTRDFFLFDYIYSTFPRISKSLAHFKFGFSALGNTMEPTFCS